jgi:hypothetical protein
MVATIVKMETATGTLLEMATEMDLQVNAVGTPHPGLATQPALFGS